MNINADITCIYIHNMSLCNKLLLIAKWYFFISLHFVTAATNI